MEYIKGFVHQNESEAFMATVRIVPDIKKIAGEYAGYMEIANSDEKVYVTRHPGGSYNGQIIR